MKRTLRFLLLLPFTLFLCGCPYDSPYNLDEAPLQNIDKSLIGQWATPPSNHGNDSHSQKQEPVKIIIGKRTGMEYDIAITGHIQELRPWHVVTNDSIHGTAYLSAVAGRQFLNTYIHGKVYIAEILKDSCSISILPLAEYFTSKLIKNSKELRVAVEFHYRVNSSPGYDPLFCLKKLQKVN